MRSHTLSHLTRLKSIKRKFKCAQVEQDTFNKNEWILAHDTLLTYPDFNKKFNIYTDASGFQLVVVIIQKDKSIAFYSRKITDSQKWYTVTDRKPISIVETLKKFRAILSGHKLIIYTDNKNLTCKIFNT